MAVAKEPSEVVDDAVKADAGADEEVESVLEEAQALTEATGQALLEALQISNARPVPPGPDLERVVPKEEPAAAAVNNPPAVVNVPAAGESQKPAVKPFFSNWPFRW